MFLKQIVWIPLSLLWAVVKSSRGPDERRFYRKLESHGIDPNQNQHVLEFELLCQRPAAVELPQKVGVILKAKFRRTNV